MRRIAMLSLIVAGLFLSASAAVARANWYHQQESSGGPTSEMTSPSSGPGESAPEVGTYESQQPTETGSLPAWKASASSIGEYRSMNGFRELEYGEKDTAGVDTGP